jgi:hypothetical protein
VKLLPIYTHDSEAYEQRRLDTRSLFMSSKDLGLHRMSDSDKIAAPYWSTRSITAIDLEVRLDISV